MRRIVELVWLTLFVSYAAWLTYLSYTVIPEPPCDWWAFVPPLERPPGLGMPQLGLMAVLAAIFAVIAHELRSPKNRTIIFFALTIPLLFMTLPLMAVVDIEIHGGCIQFGGPEFSRYSSSQLFDFMLIIGAPFFLLFAIVIAMIIFATVYFAKRIDKR